MSSKSNLLFNSPAGHFWQLLENKKLLVAFSGGKDSLSLLKYLLVHKETMGWIVHACYINHLIRPTSYLDVAFCRSWCEDNDVIFHLRECNILVSDSCAQRGVEYSARHHRYKLLEDVRLINNLDYILTAHTYNDQIESFFVDLLTGASLYTIGGVRELVNNNIVRPFLNITEKMVFEFLEYYKLTPIFDETNLDTRYVRNNVRKTLIPYIEEFFPEMQRSIISLQTQSRALNSWFDDQITGLIKKDNNSVLIDKIKFLELGLPVRTFLLGKYVSQLCRGGDKHLEIINSLLSNRNNKVIRVNLPSNYICEISEKTIRFFEAKYINYLPILKKPFESEVDLLDKKIIFSSQFLGQELIIRRRKIGDRYEGKLLKKLFSQRKIPHFYRDSAVVVENRGLIVWVEHIVNFDYIEVIIKKGS